MLHLENFFEKSFALLLTTPNMTHEHIPHLQSLHRYDRLD